ncbi:inhibitor of nuclear factor kappa-B kinase-interacting protein isoform X1 [Pseudophryne corroboree]|uniref:inhibitor of nuclear factor kappa-B kinase-interacting protein isoform X1 n=1 Tax=Pseudophryne corroboree TaxID=495146 RepID=UPI0030812F58
MSNEVKQRKKGGASTTAKEVKDTQRSGTAIGQRNGQRAGTTPGQQEGQRSGTPSGQQEGQRSGTAPVRRAQGEQPGKVVVDSSAHGSRSQCSDIRTVLCSLCLAICVALIWTVFQHSQNFAVLEQKYQALQSRSSALEELESKVGHIIGKLVSTDDISAEAIASHSIVTNLQKQVSTLYSDMDRIQVNEQAVSEKMQNVNLKLQNVTNSWKGSLDKMNLETNSAKSEAKSFHHQMTLKINAADQTLKLISEKLKEFEESTPRNFRTVKRQEDDDLQRITEVLDYDAKAIEELEKQENDLTNMNQEVQQNLMKFQPKLAECMTNLPTIDNAVRTLLKVSNEMLDLDKKINELTVQVFSTEDNLLKIITETLEIQQALEGMQYDNSILKMQNEISSLKDKVQILSANKDHSLSEKEESDEG